MKRDVKGTTNLGSPLKIQYLFLMPDSSGIDGLFYASDRRLIELSPYLNILKGLPRSINEYPNSIPMKAFLDTIIGYHSFSIRFISESTMKEVMKSLDVYPFKVLILRKGVDEKTLQTIKLWGKRPIILSEDSSFSTYLKSLFDSSVLFIGDMDLNKFEVELCRRVDDLMNDNFYVDSLPWSKTHIEILSKATQKIRNKKKSFLPFWPLRNNRLLEATDLIINRNRGHIDCRGIEIESSEEKWIKESVSAVYKCFAEIALMEVLAYFENNELTEESMKALKIDKESLTSILNGSNEEFNQVVGEFIKRTDLLQRNNGIILWCPSVNPYFQRRLYPVLNGVYHQTTGKRLPERIIKAFLKDTGYIIRFSPKDLLRGDKELQDLFLLLLAEYKDENDLQSNLTAFYSLRNNRPCIKTQKLSSNLFGKMRQLQNLLLQTSITPQTIKNFDKLWKEFRRDITDSISFEIRELLGRLPKMSVKFISDLPLEWVEINGTPLMFTREFSRLPLTSANGMCAHYQITEEPLPLSTDIGKPEVLLIDGILEEDPVKSFTKSTFELLMNRDFSTIFKISVQEVRNIKELFDSVSERKPFICVIDAHAKYETNDDQGYIQIGESKWNPWLEQLPYPPPIIILNSCQTSVIDGTFNTAANGLLANGVRSIIGTLFPISAEIAAYMCVRLFANLQAALTGEENLKTWQAIVSKTILLNHYLDYFVQFGNYLRKKQPNLILKLRNFPLDYTAKWNSEKALDKIFEERVFYIVSEVIKDYGLDEEFNQFLEQRGILPETSFFVSLGSPESIRIFKPGNFKPYPMLNTAE